MERRTFREWALDELAAAARIIMSGLIGAAIVGVLADQPWLLALLIPAALLWRLQNPRS